MARGRVMASTKDKLATQSGEHRVSGYLAPWYGIAAASVVGVAAHLLFGGQMPDNAVAAVIETVATGVLAVVAWDSGRPRDRHMQIFATAFTTVMGMWVIVATIFGPQRRPVWGLLLFAVVFVAAHNIRRVLRGQGGDDEQAGTLAAKIREAGRRVKNVRVDADTGVVESRVIANREQETIERVQKDLPPLIEALEGLPRGSAQVIEDPNDRGAGTLRIIDGRALEGTVPWLRPSAPGESIALPIPVGTYADRARAKLWLPGDPATGRNASHIKCIGMTGAGKTEGLKKVATEGLTRRDFVLWGSCHIKGIQTFGPLREYMDWCVVDEGGDIAAARGRARAMLATTRRLVSYNGQVMGAAGYKQWEPEVFTELGIPFTMVYIEEAGEITEDSDSFTLLCQQARSTGVIIVWANPRAAHTSISTDARAQFGTEWCFGVSSSGNSDDASFGLPEVVRDAGADPAAWGNRKPGMSYLVAPGIDDERWTMPLRTDYSTDDQLQGALDEHASGVTLSPDAVRALGPEYAKRQRFTTTAGTLLVPGQTAAPAAETDEDDYDDDEDGDMKVLGALDPEVRVNSEEPIETPEVNMNFAVPVPAKRLSTAEARAVVQQHLRTLLEQGHDRTQAADIFKMRPETTRSSEWVRTELARLCADPAEGEISLERDDEDDVGVFRIVALEGAEASSALTPV